MALRMTALVVGGVLTLPLLAQQPSPRELFERARLLEESSRSLEDAIALYTQVSDQSNEPELSATALLRIGLLHERLGRTAEAQRAFQAVVTRYPDLVTIARQAASKLAPRGAAAVAGGLATRRIWAGPDVDVLGAVSADGRYLSHVDWETGDLAVRDVVGGTKRRVTNKGPWTQSPEMALFSVISRDSRQIAYSWFNKDLRWDLRIVPLEGGSPRILYDNENVLYVAPLDWSPDGKTIVALLSRKDRTNQIALIGSADGAVRVIKTFDWRYPQKTSLSPDGRFIAYDLQHQPDVSERDLFLLAVDGSADTPLVQHPADDFVLGWTPDGAGVLFGSDRTGSAGVWLARVRDGRPVGVPESVKPNTGYLMPLGFTAAGAFYYGVVAAMRDVYLATLDPTITGTSQSPASISQRYLGGRSAPDWSPDGQSIAYLVQKNSPQDQRLFVRSLATGQEREIPARMDYIRRPRWSPDGRLTVAGIDMQRRAGIHWVDAQTGEVSPIVLSSPDANAEVNQFAWHPNGRVLVYVRQEFGAKRSVLVARNVEDESEVNLLTRDLPQTGIRTVEVAPDGRQVAFIQDSDASIYAMSLMGGAPRLLWQPPAGGVVSALAWSRDSRSVLFFWAEKVSLPQKSTLSRVAVDGSEPASLGILMEQMNGLRVHPDGRRIAFAAGQQKFEVWMLENFLPPLSGGARTGVQR